MHARFAQLSAARHGRDAAHPRCHRVTVSLTAASLRCADAVAEGAKYVPEAEEWLEEHGMLLRPEDEEEVADKQQEEAMLASEFTGGRWLARC